MNKHIIKKILITLILIIPTYSFSNSFKYIADKKLPLEFIYLIKSYQNYDLMKKEEVSFKGLISFYDQAFRKISKEERFHLIKSQIYKNIINFFPISYKKKSKVDVNEIKEKLEKKLTTRSNDPFKEWLISALIRDIKLFNKNKSSKRSNLYYSLFYNWNSFFDNSYSQEINRKLKDLSKKILINLKNRLSDFLLISKNISLKEQKEIILKEMIFFKIVKETIPIEKQEIDKKSKILKILEPINEKSLILPGTISRQEWFPKDQSLNINVNPPKPDPNYIPPKSLPSPTNDW